MLWGHPVIELLPVPHKEIAIADTYARWLSYDLAEISSQTFCLQWLVPVMLCGAAELNSRTRAFHENYRWVVHVYFAEIVPRNGPIESHAAHLWNVPNPPLQSF